MNDSIHECWINQMVRLKEEYNVNKNTRKIKMKEEFLRRRRREMFCSKHPYITK